MTSFDSSKRQTKSLVLPTCSVHWCSKIFLIQSPVINGDWPLTVSACCTTGVTHTGKHEGQLENINATLTYVALPSGDYDHSKALIFLHDIFGLGMINSEVGGFYGTITSQY